ncbi:MAG TPA: sigma-70 family RNA polymerase sigma factor [Sedimentisphaerales bacterium]|jgi:RNA polymerase sigma-70 factor (ECF subfamily)|nr:sigma-70 family RNA polymerase sigma factor [Sedimentisphaerales bacterium]HNU31566.1 sigma-70 family RNA polymerase sigma factor [Sedimentisphaerales bacterium]
MDDDPEQPVDELLVMDCQDGSRKAMEQLVWRWQKRLWRYALRLTGDSHAAWDVTQESWLAVVRGISRLNDPARFGPWVYRIVTNKADDWIRKRSRMASLPADFDREARQADGPQAAVAACDLNGAVHRLSHAARTVLTLYYLEGFALSDIAAVLRVPQGTVKSRLHAARNELKVLWGDTPE